MIELLRGGRAVQEVWIARGSRGQPVEMIRKLASARGVTVKEVSRDALDKESRSHSNQGVIAFAEPFVLLDLDSLLKRATERARELDEAPFVVVLAEIQDPHNLGSLVRSASAAGAGGVVVPRHRSASITPVVHKASAGAVEHMPVAQVTNISRTLDQLKEAGYWVYGTAADGELSYSDADLSGPVALVVGNEGRGLPRLVAEHCDLLVSIPMTGPLDSLNAAVAGGIVMFEVRRQRSGS